MFKRILLALTILLLFVSCEKNITQQEWGNQIDMTDLDVPDDFDYNTFKNIDVNISVHVNGDDPVPDIKFRVLFDHPDEGGTIIASGATNSEGSFSQRIIAPVSTDSLVVVGYMSTLTLPVIDNSATFDFGTQYSSGKDDQIIYPLKGGDRDGISFNFLSGYDSEGLPENVEYVNVSTDIISRINASLPEWTSVPASHPEYLADGNQTNIHLIDESEVHITFVHEGAGYLNSLGYYTYDYEEGPPESNEDLDHMIFFSNASIPPLQPGATINIGTYPAGTVIGWFLVVNGWNSSNQTVHIPSGIIYSDPQYNTDGVDYRQHNVFLYDEEEEKYIIGFEDLRRPYGDEDFNDAVFYVSANPPDGVDQEYVPSTDTNPDSDGDGIADNFDEYPQDPDRAFNVYYPSEGKFGTLAFEDLWPNKGDFDFNDMVIDYNFTHVNNRHNNLVDIIAILKLRAIGAGYHNAFCIELPFPENRISSYSGDISSFQTDANTGNAIIKIFNDAFQVIQSGTNQYVNTDPNEPYIQTDTLNFTITLDSPISPYIMTYTPPYNPFIRIHGDETLEVHLPDYPATSLANTELFGTEDDSTDPGIERFYKTSQNLPWAVNIAQSWNYPIEKMEITWGYLNFATWAESGGNSNLNWFINNPENTDDGYIYTEAP